MYNNYGGNQGNGQRYGGNGGFNNNRGGGYGAPRQTTAAPVKIQAKPLPEDYVKRAEDAISSIKNERKIITTSKLRNLFGLFTDTYNELKFADTEKLTTEQVTDLRSAKVRVLYEIGREEGYRAGDMTSGSIALFVDRTELLSYMADIGDSIEKFDRFYKYFEALVAYYRFYINR